MKASSTWFRRCVTVSWTGMLLFGCGKAALAADAQPGDFALVPPPGTNLNILYYTFQNSDSYVSQNGKRIPYSSVQSNVLIERYVHYFQVEGKIVDINLIVPFGGFTKSNIGGVGISHEHFAMGDTSIVSTVWAINAPKKNLYLAFATWVNAPTGEYHSNMPFSLGDNRWSFEEEPALHFNLTPKFGVDLVGSATIYGDNTNGPNHLTLSQGPSYTGIVWLNYTVMPGAMASLGVYNKWIGEQKIGGLRQGGGDVLILRAAWQQMLNPTNQVLVQVAGDPYARNTFKNNFSLMLRWVKIF